MAKKKTVSSYITELKKMIKSRTGVDMEPWLMPQVRTTAMNLVVLDKIQVDLEKDDLTTLETGVAGQQKTVVNPLLVTYKDMQRTLLLQFEALGLNYKATPSKVTESVKKGGAEHDALMDLLNDAKRV